MADARNSGVPDVSVHRAGPVARDVNEESVRAELEKVLQSPEFRASRRSQEFLTYVVQNTLGGRSDLLKERTIGIDVFGRPSTYDPSEDATVRVKAGEVRKRLGLYYLSDGRDDEVRIELPPGTYVPEFRTVDHPVHHDVAAPITEPSPAVPGAAVAEQPAEHSKLVVWIVGAILAMAALALIGWYEQRPSETALEQFWAPVLGGTNPVLICASFVPVYGVDRGPNESGPPRAEQFTLLTDQFVGGGDLLAESRVSALMNRLHRAYRVKLGNDVSFQDLRTGPTILIGYSYTRWKEISRELRFFIDADARPLMISDNGQPTKWSLPNLPADRRTNEDYAIVSRVFHPDTGAMLVEIAGITQYGTEAAAELVSNPDLLNEAVQGAPKGWQLKNLQIVLHTKVISGTPTAPKVIATHFW